MRNFINWEILKRIEKSPGIFIVQRNVALLEAFLFGYVDLYLHIENEEKLKSKYSNIPSLEEYAREKYNAHNIGTRNFKSIISFTCEDEREFFYKYFEFLKEYEQKYPIQERISYTVREKPKFDFNEMLFSMRKRYPMFFFNYDISRFRAFLDGYFLCKKEFEIPLTLLDKKIIEFTKSVVCQDLNLTGEFVTWDRLFRYERDWNAWGDIEESNAKKIQEEFWDSLEQIIKK